MRHSQVPGIVLLSLAAVLGAAYAAGVRLNRSASLPLGLYMRTNAPTDYVNFCLGGALERMALEREYIAPGHRLNSCPGGGSPLEKLIAGRPGDEVVLDECGITVNGKLLPNTFPRSVDSHGRRMPEFPFGQYTVPDGELWVYSSYDDRSFDSRYYGGIHANTVQFHLRELWVSK